MYASTEALAEALELLKTNLAMTLAHRQLLMCLARQSADKKQLASMVVQLSKNLDVISPPNLKQSVLAELQAFVSVLEHGEAKDRDEEP